MWVPRTCYVWAPLQLGCPQKKGYVTIVNALSINLNLVINHNEVVDLVHKVQKIGPKRFKKKNEREGSVSQLFKLFFG